MVHGENIKAAAAYLYNEGVVANDRIRTFIHSLSGDSLDISEGSIYNFCRSFSARCVEAHTAIENQYGNQCALQEQ